MEIQRVGIVGAGTMGAGIAQICLQSGYQVFLCDAKQEVLEKAKGSITARLQKLNKEETLSNLHLNTQIADLASCQAVIEAVPERLELKKAIFQELASVCADDTLLLSNTSSISITEIAAGIPHPERILGFHFFNPAPVMPLIEVIVGYQSGQEERNQTIDFAVKLGKKPITVKDSPGFIVNRVARPYYNEALRIAGDGIASVEQIDRIMTRAGGFKMGPFALQDLIGIDINFATTQSVYQGFFQESRFKPSRLQQRMVQAGTLGKKTGGGFYEYTH
jgi:3-hydroxybutyryl-CoA dehydrogenase